MFDILIQNSLIIDGSGAEGYLADVAVKDGRILGIGHFDKAQARTLIDASGLVLTPGFVDMHSHADLTLPICPTADNLVHQGITTAVTGQCGFSPAPLFDETREAVIGMMGVEGSQMPWEKWDSFESHLAYLAEIGISINIAPLVAHGTIRGGVMGFRAGKANAEERENMRAEVVKAMESGAIGVSTGLIYPPGSFADTEELIDFTRPIAEFGGTYFSHIRGESATLLEAITEAIQIGREAGVAVQLSHFKAAGSDNWHKAIKALALIDQARAEGLDVTADMYPYLAGNTMLVSVLPQWAQEGGKEAILQNLRDSETHQKMSTAMLNSDFLRISDWGTVQISESPQNITYEGRTVADLATEADKSPHDWVFNALLETELDLGMIIFMMSEENRRLALRHPAMMVGTDAISMSVDGVLGTGKPHPRNYGAFPRVLAKYVREENLLSLEEAIHKMSGLPAKKLGWTDRGLIKEGYWADLVILNPETVKDTATYTSPHQYPEGILHVIVNGKLVVHGETHQGTRSGIFL